MTVTQNVTNDGSLVYLVEFNADLGDVPILKEASNNVNSTITEKIQGVASGNRIQLKIENKPTGLFRLNDTRTNVNLKYKRNLKKRFYKLYLQQINAVISDSFGIKCPASILTSTDSIISNDYEYCSWANNQLNETAFCGKCSKKNSNNLFWNKNTTLDYKYICFAYKLTKQPFTVINYQIIDPLIGSLITLSINVQSIADNQWHYGCFDLTPGFQTSVYSKYLMASIRLYQVSYSHLNHIYCNLMWSN